MHKVRGNYSSCTCKSSENISSNNGGALEKGKTGRKPDETQCRTKSGSFLSWTPCRAPLLGLAPPHLQTPGIAPNSSLLTTIYLCIQDAQR